MYVRLEGQIRIHVWRRTRIDIKTRFLECVLRRSTPTSDHLFGILINPAPLQFGVLILNEPLFTNTVKAKASSGCKVGFHLLFLLTPNQAIPPDDRLLQRRDKTQRVGAKSPPSYHHPGSNRWFICKEKVAWLHPDDDVGFNPCIYRSLFGYLVSPLPTRNYASLNNYVLEVIVECFFITLVGILYRISTRENTSLL